MLFQYEATFELLRSLSKQQLLLLGCCLPTWPKPVSYPAGARGQFRPLSSLAVTSLCKVANRCELQPDDTEHAGVKAG